MTSHQLPHENINYGRATVQAYMLKGQTVWMLPGRVMTKSHSVADRAARVMRELMK